VAAMRAVNAQIDIIVADNSTEKQDVVCQTPKNVSITIHPTTENLGYLGGIINSMKISNLYFDEYIYVIISNVDVLLPPDFFAILLSYNKDKSLAWIAPKIISQKERRDRNPKILNRPVLNHIDRLRLLYKYPILYYLYTKTLYKRKKLQQENNRQEIYAGHGSFMIFTGNFIEKNREMEFPCFLFGEEIFLAELVRKNNKKVMYEPDIKVYDIDHVSTGKMSIKKLCQMNYDSLTKIKKHFYE
jgi:GT2 family glycosyltransferase